MKVQEVMERAGTTQSGRAIAYIKDALEEIELLFETNIDYSNIWYDLQDDYIEIEADRSNYFFRR